VELTQHQALAHAVVTDEPFVLVDLAFGVLGLRRVFAPVAHANEARIERPGIVAANHRRARLALGCSLPESEEERNGRKGIRRCRRLLTAHRDGRGAERRNHRNRPGSTPDRPPARHLYLPGLTIT